MTTIRLLVISAAAFLICLLLREILETPVSITDFASSQQLSNKDKAYQFKVPEDGQMMRFEVVGRTPMNTWKSVDIDVYDQVGNYLFTYQDELWAETGRDSDGRWTEYRDRAEFTQHFPKKGIYEAYVSESSGPSSRIKTNDFRFRVVPVLGNSRLLTPLVWVSGAIAFVCLLILGNRMDKGRPISSYKKPRHPLQKPQTNKSTMTVIALFFAPTLLLTAMAFQKDDDDIDWLYASHSSKQMTVDRELRQQSLSGAQFRTGGSRGGK